MYVCVCVLCEVQVFPGQGGADATLTSVSGWTNVTGERNQYIDNWLGMGGNGSILVSVWRPAAAMVERCAMLM